MVEAGPFLVDGPTAVHDPAQSVTASAGFPVWPALGGGLGLILPAAAGAALFFRRRRGH